MKKLLMVLLLFTAISAHAQIATHVVISEVYGGGGNTSAVFRNDFIELYNPSVCAVSLAGWSVQYASATGSSWAVTALTGTIPAKGFYLIREAAGTGGTTNLPTPNDTGSIAMAAAAGKVALVNTNTALSGTCPTGTQIIDFVGFGSTAGCYEGTSPAPAPGNTTSIERKASSTSTAATLGTGGSEVSAGNGYDANANGTDFAAQSAVNPQNNNSIEGTVGNTVSIVAGINAAEPATDGTFAVMLSTAAPSGGVTVTYSLAGTATGAGTDYTDAGSGSITIPMGNTSGTITVNVVDDVLSESNETIILTPLTTTGSYTLCPASATISIIDNDTVTTYIHTIQGSGTAAAAGVYRVEAIVTGVYPSLSPAGFYIQEEDSNADANANTSEGIFVVSSAPVAVGDLVRINGTIQENASAPSFDQAVFTGSSFVTILSRGNALPGATNIHLPVAAMSDYEKYEGMLIRFTDTLTVTDNINLGKYGELSLSAGGLVYQPTQIIDPNDSPPAGTTSTGASNVAAINALLSSDSLRTILLDDGYNVTTKLPYVDRVDSTLRIGSTIDSLTGIVGYAFGVYRIQPVTIRPPSFKYAARPAVPAAGNANLRIASFNVLNYFNGDGVGGGFPTPRGANSAAEFSRQRAKIINAIAQMNADIVGLTELENDGTGPKSAIRDLVNGIDSVLGAGAYSIIDDGANIQNFGTDAIRCGIIYKPAVVTPSGPAMLSPASAFNRPPVAQAFTLISTGVTFNYIINHFKSKRCSGSTGADMDQADGQSCFNDFRKQQSIELLNFIDTAVIPHSGTDLILAMGDYNSYYEEDPLDILRAATYTVLGTSATYSFQFDGQIGSLDHAIVSNSMNRFVTGMHKWNINAAEPVYLGYDDAVDDGGSDVVNPYVGTYAPAPYRSSDHDPVLVGLNLPGAQGVGNITGPGSLPVTVVSPGSHGIFDMICTLPQAATLTTTVYDLTGREVAGYTRQAVKGVNRMKLETALPAGAYIVRISNGLQWGIAKAALL